MSIRVLQLISSGGFFGAERVMLELSKEVAASGVAVTVGVFDNSGQHHLEIERAARASGLGTRVFKCQGSIDFSTVARIGAYVRDEQIDLVHSHGYKSNAYALASTMGRGLPLVSTCHNWIDATARSRRYAWLDKIVLRRFAAVVPVSSDVEAELVRSGVRRERITKIGNGVAVAEYHYADDPALRRELGIDLKARVIGTVGRLSREKGVGDLLEAARRVIDAFAECVFLIVGDGPLAAELNARAHALGIAGRVRFAGTRRDVPRLLGLMDVFVLPSYVEGQPMALLEAMASGRPVIATGVGDVPEIVHHGESGTIVAPGEPAAMAHGILFYLKDPGEAARVAAEARREVARRYSASAMAAKYLTLYHAVTGAPVADETVARGAGA